MLFPGLETLSGEKTPMRLFFLVGGSSFIVQSIPVSEKLKF
jgi:hypothetical protein